MNPEVNPEVNQAASHNHGQRGLFISLEGIEGSGKSTQSRLLYEALKALGYDVVHTLEPGGTPIGLKIRALLLDPSHKALDPMAELMLYAAARRQHMAEVILPVLNRGGIVVTDRFSDSTTAYQGHGRGLDFGLIRKLDDMVTGGLMPHLTLLMDLDVETGLTRNKAAGKADRLELEDISFHKRVREGFLSIQDAEPWRVQLIDTRAKAVDEIHQEALAIVTPMAAEARSMGRLK